VMKQLMAMKYHLKIVLSNIFNHKLPPLILFNNNDANEKVFFIVNRLITCLFYTGPEL
jgi:hypothetical protein